MTSTNNAQQMINNHQFRHLVAEKDARSLGLMRYNQNEGLWKFDGTNFVKRRYSLDSSHVKRETIAKIKDMVPTITEQELDANPYLVHCTDKTLDFQSGKARAHNPDDLITRSTGLEYSKANNADKWQELLDNFYPYRSHNLINSFGSTVLVNDGLKDPKILSINGETNTCKTTLGLIIHKIVGGNVSSPDLSLINKGGNERMWLENEACQANIIFVDEKTSRRFDNEWLKRMTGGGTITARGIRQQVKTYTNVSIPVLMTTNTRPADNNEYDEAFYKRMRCVETIKPAQFQVDPHWVRNNILSQPDELAGILKLWMETYPNRKFADGWTANERYDLFDGMTTGMNAPFTNLK